MHLVNIYTYYELATGQTVDQILYNMTPNIGMAGSIDPAVCLSTLPITINMTNFAYGARISIQVNTEDPIIYEAILRCYKELAETYDPQYVKYSNYGIGLKLHTRMRQMNQNIKSNFLIVDLLPNITIANAIEIMARLQGITPAIANEFKRNGILYMPRPN